MANAQPKEKKLNSNPEPSSTSLGDCSFPVRLQILANKLTDAEKRVGEYFLKNPNAAYLSITEVVEDSSLGYGTIIRFCRKIGCAGFQEFKVLLAQELGNSSITPGATGQDAVSIYAEKIKTELANTEKLIDRNVLADVIKVVNNSRQILIAGIAGSEPLARGFDYRLSRLGICSSAICEGYTLDIRASSLQPGDVLFAISFSGATKDILASAELAKTAGAKIISLTNFVNAPLVEISDYSLFSATDRDPMACEIFSNISLNFVLDVVFTGLFELRKDAKKMVEKTFKAISGRRI
jgi:RpiR family transcriptional regulator, carbohydrate utilization regulator